MKSVCCILGTRPDAIKMAPVIRALRARPKELTVKVLATAQHREMLDQVLRAFEVTPDHDLDLMQSGQTLPDLTARLLQNLDTVLADWKPDVVLAQGDTTTTFVAALSAFYQRIPFGHVEAGLRTKNRYDPYPEELNRVLTGQIAAFHFAPTTQAIINLAAEGITDGVYLTGNTGIDALLYAREKGKGKRGEGKAAVGRQLLVTVHRRESWGEPHRRIARAIKRFISEVTDACVVLSLHMNPLVREVMLSELDGIDRVELIEPPDYFEFVRLLDASYATLTDSGGIQEEAPSLGVPVLVARETTERPEGVEAGCAKLVGTSEEGVYAALMELFTDPTVHDRMGKVVNPYGDGKAAERIADIITKSWEGIAA